MVNLSQEIALQIIGDVIKVVPYFQLDIQQQILLRNKIEEELNDYEITSKSTELSRCDILEKAFLYLACKKLEGIKDTTRYNYTLLLKRMNEYFLKPLSSISTMDLRIFLAKEYKNNQANSLNCKISLLKSFFGWLQDEGYMLQNPSKNLQIIKEPYRRRGHILPLDVERMRNACETIREKTIINFLFATGCRVSEVTNACIDRIDWQDNSIMVIGKGDKERKVFFDPKTRLCLLEYIETREQNNIFSNSLFVTSKFPYAKLGQRSIERDFKEIAQRANITYNVSVHWARHSFACSAISHNIPIHVLSKMLGHNNLSTTELYFTIDDLTLKQEYQKISL